ncbi:ATP/GTP-binding protein [Streptomyces sp. YC504]|uniref:ATP/GTP-binding protein n=1 Tax=Streptomyces mesophilus TaxID=1775132 RepID=A0A6G4XJJ6_9ACTN|nr:ATP/GTP-binding protein [Streptomyces mesophilus]NGO77746.1 ATP/GTP-binding protein [Streptomyces mesophilus]
MAGRDLRALFSVNDRTLAAGEAFTNRQAQWDLVTAALSAHLQHIAGLSFSVEDVEAPRDNVLVFYGIGGIGKTALSRKLEVALADTTQRPAQWAAFRIGGARLVPVRIDLARSANTDFEQIVFTIRLALAAALNRPLPAFDLALRRYWEHVHPGEPLEEYLRRGGLASKFGQSLPQQLQSALADVAQALTLPGTVGSLIGQVTTSLVGALRERRQSVRALAGCARLADLLEAEPDLDALSYYPHLLAWELAQLGPADQVVPVILFDTFEDVGTRTHRDLERLLQRITWLMPNAYFIVTGRDRLQWADEGLHGQLDLTGPTAWPGLTHGAVPRARTAPEAVGHRHRQILIGDFSAQDCDDYLSRRLTTDGQPLITPAIRTVITSRSHGLPLYLDLSVMRYLDIRRTGRTPEPADFDTDFSALIARTLQDLTPEERNVLRSVALLDSFDLPLATAAAGLDREAPVQRLIERPFIRENPYGIWPYHLHALTRSTLRTADDHTDDAWTTADWRTAARRAFAALGQQYAQHTGTDRLLLVSCLRQGPALAADFDLHLDWLEAAAWQYISDSVWEPLAPPTAEPGRELHTAAGGLVELLSAIARRQHEHRERTVERLQAVIATAPLPTELFEMAVYYQAKAQRDLGRTADSRAGMQLVAAGGGRLATAARRGLAHLARISGDFPTALEAARTLGVSGRHHRVRGDVLWPQGDMTGAAAAYEAARNEADQHGVAGERAHGQAHRALAVAFINPAAADDEIDLAHHYLTGLDLRATTLTVQIAELVRDAGTTTTQFGDRAHLLRTEAELAGLTAVQVLLELAVAFHQAVQAAPIDGVLERLRTLTAGGEYPYYVDIAAFMADRPLEAPSPASWLTGLQHTRERWHSLVAIRRNSLRRPR